MVDTRASVTLVKLKLDFEEDNDFDDSHTVRSRECEWG